MPIFRKVLNETFPCISTENPEIEHALNLISAVLRYHPWNRPAASSILRHPFFFKEQGGETLEPDEIWNTNYNECGKTLTLTF